MSPTAINPPRPEQAPAPQFRPTVREPVPPSVLDAIGAAPMIPVPEEVFSVSKIEAITRAAAGAAAAVHELNSAMRATTRLSPPWGLLAAAFAAGGLVTFVLLAVR